MDNAYFSFDCPNCGQRLFSMLNDWVEDKVKILACVECKELLRLVRISFEQIRVVTVRYFNENKEELENG